MGVSGRHCSCDRGVWCFPGAAAATSCIPHYDATGVCRLRSQLRTQLSAVIDAVCRGNGAPQDQLCASVDAVSGVALLVSALKAQLIVDNACVHEAHAVSWSCQLLGGVRSDQFPAFCFPWVLPQLAAKANAYGFDAALVLRQSVCMCFPLTIWLFLGVCCRTRRS
jgi:hypothetical protein